MTVDQALVRVNEAVEKVMNDADQRFPEAASVGDAVRQGDIYIQKIDDVTSTPKLYKKLNNVKYPMQLAPGNTQGSRHMLEEAEGTTVYVLNISEIPAGEEDNWELVQASTAELAKDIQKISMELTGEDEAAANKWRSESSLIGSDISGALNFCGPIFNLSKETKVSHPEHGDWILGPGSYRIAFQRTVDSNLNIRRVFD
jgi:hypothetical protein